MVTAFAPYKRVDLAIELFNRRDEVLTIVGSGQDEKKLRALAGANVTFEGSVSQERLRELYRNAKALIYPGEEDFGIIPVEAMACGTPVIAYGKGGALETVTPLRDGSADKPTGVYFNEQTVESLEKAVDLFEANSDKFNVADLSRNASKFAKDVFLEKMKGFLAPYVSPP